MAIQSNYTFDELIANISAAISVIDEYRGIPVEVLDQKLNPETWSCTEVCKHLIQFNRLYLTEMENALNKLENKPAGEEPWSVRWFMRKLGNFIEPPYKFGVKTISPMLPVRVDLSAQETLNELEKTNNELLEILKTARSEKWNIDEIKGRNPVFKFRMSLTEFIVYIDAHQRRHFWQIEQILKRLPDLKEN